jgi:hypothetical protein
VLVEPDGARVGSLGAPELNDEGARVASEVLWSEISERRGPLFVDVVCPGSARIQEVPGWSAA